MIRNEVYRSRLSGNEILVLWQHKNTIWWVGKTGTKEFNGPVYQKYVDELELNWELVS